MDQFGRYDFANDPRIAPPARGRDLELNVIPAAQGGPAPAGVARHIIIPDARGPGAPLYQHVDEELDRDLEESRLRGFPNRPLSAFHLPSRITPTTRGVRKQYSDGTPCNFSATQWDGKSLAEVLRECSEESHQTQPVVPQPAVSLPFQQLSTGVTDYTRDYPCVDYLGVPDQHIIDILLKAGVPESELQGSSGSDNGVGSGLITSAYNNPQSYYSKVVENSAPRPRPPPPPPTVVRTAVMSSAASTQQPQSGAPAAPQLLKGIVKQVLSGDSIIIRGQPKGGPPPERQLNFSNITAPRLARRPGGAGAKPDEGKDEPWAWESREFVRKKLIGKEVTFAVDYKVPASGREYGTVYLGKDTETGENVTEEIVREGLASVRKEGKADVAKLVELEEQAKSAGRGRWGADSEKHVRDVHWQVENPRQLLDKFGRKPVDAVVEHVRDGSTVRVFLTPSFHYITLMMSGIRCPGVKLDAEGKPDLASREPFSEEAKFFTESRLLQRDVQIILESVNNANLVGSIIHPNGNIAELLLKEGFARCIDWSMGFVTGGAEKLRAGEKFAKEKKLRIWKDYTITAANNTTASLKAKDKEFIGTVTECVNADALVVRLGDGTAKKVFLASIRPPRLSEEKGAEDKEKEKGKPMRPLYDIPFMYEAREYMRKKLIGKRVNVTVDYIQPASQTFPEKICCTVKLEGANIAEALVSKGYATVVRYRQDDDQRASEYDALLAAEARAQKAAKGLHGKEVPVHHVVDLSGDATKAKQFLPYLQRAGKITAVVEYVASGSRLRLFVPRETRLITFLLAGISCPRAGRPAGAPGSGPPVEGEPFGEEALAFTKDLCHQREVEIEVESIDKAGNFIGFLWIENKNLSVALVEEGLSQVHFTAERTPYFRPLQIAEENAKARRAKIWQNYEDTKETEIKAEDDKVERKVDPKPVLVTEVTPELHVYVQFTDEGDKLEALMNDLRRELNEKPPLTGAYTPKKGDLCVAKYSGDGEWYRARVEKSLPDGEVSVVFVDYGNRENIKGSKCAALPAIAASSLPPFAKEYSLACVNLPSDEEFANEAIHALRHDTAEGVFLLNVEYKITGVEYVTLADKTSKEDVAQNLVKEGLLLVDNRKERRLQKLVKDYQAAEQEAKRKHLCIWQYGDITEDDAREFGMGGR